MMSFYSHHSSMAIDTFFERRNLRPERLCLSSVKNRGPSDHRRTTRLSGRKTAAQLNAVLRLKSHWPMRTLA